MKNKNGDLLQHAGCHKLLRVRQKRRFFWFQIERCSEKMTNDNGTKGV